VSEKSKSRSPQVPGRSRGKENCVEIITRDLEIVPLVNQLFEERTRQGDARTKNSAFVRIPFEGMRIVTAFLEQWVSRC